MCAARLLVVVVFVSAASLSSSCAAPRASSLPALPSVQAPETERAAWLAAHAPLEHIGAHTLVLADGTQVHDVHDLLGAVDGDSATARAVAAADEADAVRDAVTVAASAGLLVGFGAMLASPAFVVGGPDPSTGQTALSLAVLGAGSVVALASAAAFAVVDDLTVEGDVQRAAAMITFGGDVRRRLRLDDDAAKTAAAPATLEAPATTQEP